MPPRNIIRRIVPQMKTASNEIFLDSRLYFIRIIAIQLTSVGLSIIVKALLLKKKKKKK